MVGEKCRRARHVRGALGVFFEKAVVPVIVVDVEGRFVSANDAALEHYGYTLDEIVEMRVHDLLAEPRPEIDDDLRQALNGTPVVLTRRPHRRRDGTVLWVVPRAGPVSIDGTTYVVSVLQDVTEVVRAERLAREEGARTAVVWDGAVEGLGSSVALFDSERRIVRINRTFESWMSLREQDIVGTRCDDLFVSCRTKQPCMHAIAAAEQRRVVRELTSERGRPLRVEIWPAPRNELGIACVHMAHDLSDQQALRTRLASADRLATLGRMTAGVAHEVNNPAAFVTLALPMAREKMARGQVGDAAALLDEASAAMRQINEVMRDLGDVAPERPRAVADLASVADRAIRLASVEVGGHSRIVRELDGDVTVDVRSPRLAQVILNLVLNAAQAMPRDAAGENRVVVRVRRVGERALVEVADRGPGVAEDLGDRIFEPFFTTRGDAGGSGLGLWLSRAIVEEEGGTLTWRNLPEGGAIFTVSLPAHRPGPTRHATPAS
jgi:PAS domain S-box-containing protein